MRKIGLSVFLLICVFFAQSQQILKGRLLAADTRMPVSSASVFLSNTGVGTVSKEDGTFQIHAFPNGRYDLVVSILGFETYILSVQSTKLPDFLEISLKPKANDLQEIVLESYDKKGWDKWGDFFKDNLIGRTPNSFDCELKNPDVIKFKFNKKENILKATADESLVIENKALGYILKYNLTAFEYNFKTNIFYYQGYPFFTEMESDKSSKIKKWQRNRYDTYQGSLMHFMRAVFRNKIKEEGFEVRKIIREEKVAANAFANAKTTDYLIDQLLTGDSIAFAVDSATAGMWFSDYLQITYPAKRMPDYYTKQYRNLQPNAQLTAEIVMPNKNARIYITANGSYYYGRDLTVLAYWAWSEKLSNLLPLEFKVPSKY
jgi:hypothetical protein